MNKNETELTISDADGNLYTTITIGNQVWMAENLRTTTFNNGDPIPTSEPSTKDIRPANHSSLLNSREFKDSPNNHITDKPTFQWLPGGGTEAPENLGRLYTWYACNDPRGICPQGWHIPTKNDWDTLIEHLGDKGQAGGKLKATSTPPWNIPNTGATNTSGFSALPAGYRDKDGAFKPIGILSAWWSNSPGLYYHIEHEDAFVYQNYYYRSEYYAFSVRCIKDAE